MKHYAIYTRFPAAGRGSKTTPRLNYRFNDDEAALRCDLAWNRELGELSGDPSDPEGQHRGFMDIDKPDLSFEDTVIIDSLAGGLGYHVSSSSERGTHVRFERTMKLREWAALFLLDAPDLVDTRWLGHQLREGAFCLRISKKADVENPDYD